MWWTMPFLKRNWYYVSTILFLSKKRHLNNVRLLKTSRRLRGFLVMPPILKRECWSSLSWDIVLFHPLNFVLGLNHCPIAWSTYADPGAMKWNWDGMACMLQKSRQPTLGCWETWCTKTVTQEVARARTPIAIQQHVSFKKDPLFLDSTTWIINMALKLPPYALHSQITSARPLLPHSVLPFSSVVVSGKQQLGVCWLKG